MKNLFQTKWKLAAVLLLLLLGSAMTARAQGPKLQMDQLDLLANKASETVDIKLDERLIQTTARFFGKDDADIKEVLKGIKGIYVKSFSFEKEAESHPMRFHGHLLLSPRPLFGGPGAAPIERDGQVIGGFSSSTSYATSGMQITIDGKQYSREDVVTAHALQIEYDDQHPDTP